MRNQEERSLFACLYGEPFSCVGIDEEAICRYNIHMDTLYGIMTQTLKEWGGKVLLKPLSARLSETALFASSDFVQSGADEAVRALNARKKECTLLGAEMLTGVTEKNGWILFDLTGEAFDAYARSLPAAYPGEAIEDPGAGYVDYRMDMLLRHGDMPFPDVEPLKRGVLVASRACGRGRWTQHDERTVLVMTHTPNSVDRIRMEQSASRAAKIILYERACMRQEQQKDRKNGEKA